MLGRRWRWISISLKLMLKTSKTDALRGNIDGPPRASVLMIFGNLALTLIMRQDTHDTKSAVKLI